MGRQLRVQRPPIRNISDLRDRCLNIWYNLSPVIYQGLVTSMPRRVEAVLHAKGCTVKFVTKTSAVVCGNNVPDGFIVSRIVSRTAVPKFEATSQYLKILGRQLT
ncbi:transposase domain containing protein [Nephila pilipes]|uniref:Transposase domain containing protein n=1 Tax=Nephila pilipes TaxID=299642 RepID=A0A8X6NI21_NEPPI|nr:transposase domain containing protein [Nephila pilipes]